MKSGPKYYGVYRGTVENNIDPEQIGRIQATVPDAGGLTPSTWITPCFPAAGKSMGTFFVPQIGSGVWVQFEGGDPDRPVYSGCWWGETSELPSLALAGVPGNPNIVIQTMLQNTLVLSDLPGPTGGIMLKSPSGASVIVNDTGIYISNGKGASIVMSGPTVTVNNGALVIS
jgi:uncharacterized protein involved in type VI secretion and phage assembly